MSVDATRWAWQQQGLTPSEKLVLLSLADRAGESHECYPSTARLVKDTGLYRETIYAAIRRFEELGLVEAHRSLGAVTHYQLKGVCDRTNQSAKADQSEKADMSAKAARTSRKKPTPTSRLLPTQNRSLNLSRTIKRVRFAPPAPQDVTLYAESIGFQLDGNVFVDHYEANGWMRGKTPLKDWKAAVRTWKTKQAEFGGERKGNGGWPQTDEGWLELGRGLGLHPKGGESWQAFRARVQEVKRGSG